MKLLFIADNYMPHATAEALCNGKLVLALRTAGYDVDVVGRGHAAITYGDEWCAPWEPLKQGLTKVDATQGNKLVRALDYAYSALSMRSYPVYGITWGRKALAAALQMHRKKAYDAILTRSYFDVNHVVGRNFVRQNHIPWFANWNDPPPTALPEPYNEHMPAYKSRRYDNTLVSCMKAATCHTFPSRELMEYFQECYPVLKDMPCRVIPHICLPDGTFTFQAGRTEAEDTCRICHSGMITKARDPELFFRAMKLVMERTGTKIQLDIMGYRDDGVEELTRRYSLQEHVRFLGNKPYGEALALQGGYDILLLLEARLGKGVFFASKLTDYARVGRPILAVSPAQGFARRTFTEWGGGEVVDNESLDSICGGLTRMVRAWRAGNLDSEYPTAKLRTQWSEQTVIPLYTGLFREFRQ